METKVFRNDDGLSTLLTDVSGSQWLRLCWTIRSSGALLRVEALLGQKKLKASLNIQAVKPGPCVDCCCGCYVDILGQEIT